VQTILLIVSGYLDISNMKPDQLTFVTNPDITIISEDMLYGPLSVRDLLTVRGPNGILKGDTICHFLETIATEPGAQPVTIVDYCLIQSVRGTVITDALTETWDWRFTLEQLQRKFKCLSVLSRDRLILIPIHIPGKKIMIFTHMEAWFCGVIKLRKTLLIWDT
jgi:hypothetical protein